MTNQIEHARNLINRLVLLRRQGANEMKLRMEFTSWLRIIFSDEEDAGWVNHYTEGTEVSTPTRTRDGGVTLGFIDSLVRSTAIEYEANLQDRRRYESGYEQVQRYAAGVIESGIPAAQVRGILSDTVAWHVYDIEATPSETPRVGVAMKCVLHEIDGLDLEQLGVDGAEHFVAFLRKHLAREQSRSITAHHITGDLGLESTAYRRRQAELLRLVNDARHNDSSAALAIQLWERFVDYLKQERGGFDASAYVDEAYLSLLARLFCANVLTKRALLSNHDELQQILSGRYFEQHWRLQNLVESDYFGWMLNPQYGRSLLAVAGDIQRDLYAYDFAARIADDLFGQLMAQLARRTRRKLLGQEWTHAWIAHGVVQKCMDMLPPGEMPRLLDMCCGPGAMLAQALKEARKRWPDLPFADFATIATGFDIDPLAVMLAKTTWIVTLADDIAAASDVVTVPVYHADSLFAVTPITDQLPAIDRSGDIPIDLDGQAVLFPATLITPAFRLMFDAIVNWAYDEARHAQVVHRPANVQHANAEAFIRSLVASHQLSLDNELTQRIADATYHLAYRMAQLAVEGRNGIWAFILRNTYRPGLVAGQFNGLVSNPPWLAMSQFADNPYLQYLDQRAASYALKPKGSAYLHLDVATIHLLHAVDMYLKPGAAIVAIVPGTVLNGQHHLPFRRAQYITAPRPVALELQEVWDLPKGTFKVPAVVAVGVKRQDIGAVNKDLSGGHLLPDTAERSRLQSTTLIERELGNRIAWVIDRNEVNSIATGEDIAFRQGADLMPRRAVCVTVEDQRGREWSVRTPRRGDKYAFTVSDAKKLKNAQFTGRVAPIFLHAMIQSRNLLPFCLDNYSAPIAVPATREADRRWRMWDLAAIRAMAYRDTALWFETVNQAMQEEEDTIALPLLHERINVRNKLSEQVFPLGKHLVVYGTGGGIACAACAAITAEQDFIVDQTLYWSLADTQEEAWFWVGLLNSDTVTEMTLDFNPSGNFGQRHLHTLPAHVIRPYLPGNTLHRKIAELAMGLNLQVQNMLENNDRVNDPLVPIQARRRQVRAVLDRAELSVELKRACVSALSG